MRSFPQAPSPPPILTALCCNSCLPSLPYFQATHPVGFNCMSVWVTGEMLACQDGKTSPGFSWPFFPGCVLVNGQDDRYNQYKGLLILFTYTVFRFCPTHLRLDLTARAQLFLSLFSDQHKERVRCCHLKGSLPPDGEWWIVLGSVSASASGQALSPLLLVSPPVAAQESEWRKAGMVQSQVARLQQMVTGKSETGCKIVISPAKFRHERARSTKTHFLREVDSTCLRSERLSSAPTTNLRALREPLPPALPSGPLWQMLVAQHPGPNQPAPTWKCRLFTTEGHSCFLSFASLPCCTDILMWAHAQLSTHLTVIQRKKAK